MTGGYLYSKSKEGGIAYVASSVGKSLYTLKNDGYILIRKVSSPHYYLGQITKIYHSVTQWVKLHRLKSVKDSFQYFQ